MSRKDISDLQVLQAYVDMKLSGLAKARDEFIQSLRKRHGGY